MQICAFRCFKPNSLRLKRNIENVRTVEENEKLWGREGVAVSMQCVQR